MLLGRYCGSTPMGRLGIAEHSHGERLQRPALAEAASLRGSWCPAKLMAMRRTTSETSRRVVARMSDGPSRQRALQPMAGYARRMDGAGEEGKDGENNRIFKQMKRQTTTSWTKAVMSKRLVPLLPTRAARSGLRKKACLIIPPPGAPFRVHLQHGHLEAFGLATVLAIPHSFPLSSDLSLLSS